MQVYEKEFEIQYNDISMNNKLSNKGILRIMQEAASLASSTCGYGLNDVSKTNVTWVLLNWKLRVFKRPIWSTKIKIKTWPRGFNKFYSYRDLELLDQNDEAIAIATSKWLIVDAQTGNITKITPEIASSYAINERSLFEEKFIEKLTIPDNFNFSEIFKVQRRDIDTNSHMNNIRYLDYAYEIIPEDSFLNEYNNVEIMYKHSIVFGDEFKCSFLKDNNSSTVVITSVDDSKLYAIIRLS